MLLVDFLSMVNSIRGRITHYLSFVTFFA